MNALTKGERREAKKFKERKMKVSGRSFVKVAYPQAIMKRVKILEN